MLDDWIRQTRESKVPTLVKLGNSIAAYRTGILAYYKCRTSNAKVEGINNKIKACGETSSTLREILMQVVSVKQEAPSFSWE